MSGFERSGDRPGQLTWHRHALSVPLALFFPLVAGAACSVGELDSPATVLVRDSADVTITESHQAVIEGLPLVSAAPRLDMGGIDAGEDHFFDGVVDAHRLGDGTIVVPSPRTQEVRFFQPDGELRHSVGRDGEGPDEFRRPDRVGPWMGDSIAVWDGMLRRITIMDAGGGFGRTLQFGPVFPYVPGVHSTQAGTLLLESAPIVFPDGAEPVQTDAELILVRSDGATRTSLGRHRWVRFARREARPFMVQPAFEVQTRFAIGPDRVWVGTGIEAEVFALDHAGRLAEIVRWWTSDRTVTAEDREAWEGAELLQAQTAEEEALARERVRGTPFADERSAYDRVLISQDGALWVREYRPDYEETPRRWLVFDAERYPVARVETPRTSTLFEVGSGFALGAYRDDLDVQHVVLYRIP